MSKQQSGLSIAERLEYLCGDSVTKKVGASGVVCAVLYAIFVDLWGGVFGGIGCLLLRHHDKVDGAARGVHNTVCNAHNKVRSALGMLPPDAEFIAKLKEEARQPAGDQPEVSAEVANAGTKVDTNHSGNLLRAMLTPEMCADLDALSAMDSGQKAQVLVDLTAELGI